jgi:hypothetical protein
MSDLVVFYSLTGKSREVAERLAADLKADLAEIVEERPRDAGGSGKLRCVIDSFLRRRPAIRPMARHAGAYDRVTLACPVWAGRIAGPARSWLWMEGRQAKKLGLALQYGGGGPHAAVFQEIEAIAGRQPEPVVEVLEAEFADKSALAKVDAFARRFSAAAAGAA